MPASWSSLASRAKFVLDGRNAAGLFKSTNQCTKNVNLTQIRACKSVGGVFHVVPSNYTFKKLINMIHFYSCIIWAPCVALIAYTNFFIGPATLSAIPEDYEPEEWEYYSHPITRFMVKYILPTHQEDYEKTCYKLYYHQMRRHVKNIELRVKDLISRRLDYQSWYYTPALTRYTRHYVKDEENLKLYGRENLDV